MRAVRLLILCALAAGAVAIAPRSARADQIEYVGPHPIQGGGFCYIEAPHIHIYAPSVKAKVMYRQTDDGLYFAGDPAPFQYEGPRYAYYGNHPIYVESTVGLEAPAPHVEYCYLEGPHYHYYFPPPEARFELKGDAYWYVGPYGPEYGKFKKRYVVINDVYRPIAYARPVVTVSPPVGYVGLVVAPPVVGVGVGVGGGAVVGGGVAAGIGVNAGIEVAIPAPVLDVQVGGPAIIVEDHAHVHHKGKFRHGKFKRGRIHF